MTAPDIDVRPWCRATPAKAGGARRFGLARLLLRVVQTLRQLDRKLLLLFATSLLPSCIIPVGPEFQDPPGVANSPPQILDPSPTWGDEVTAPATFTITVADPNLTDELFIRFLVDGELATINDNHRGPPADGSPVRPSVSNQITCQNIPDSKKTLSHHRVLAAVADRDWDLSVPDRLTPLPPGLVSSPVTWTVNITCQMSPGTP